MNTEQMKNWIDNASYEALLARWRFAKIGSPWFQGEVGEHYSKVMRERTKNLNTAKKVETSKKIGWEQ